MMTDRSPADRLDRLLLGFEDAVLSISDRDVLAEASDLDEVAALIARVTAKAVGRGDPSLPVLRPSRRSRAARGSARRRPAPAKPAVRVPILPERVRFAFMSGDMNDSEIAALLQDILSGPDDQQDD